MKFSRRDLLVYGLMAVFAVAVLWWQNGGADTTTQAVETGVEEIRDTAEADGGDLPGTDAADSGITLRADPVSGLPTIGLDDLPDEAIDTLVLIENDGPYPFDRDGITFQNREGILPDRERGHYEEFTVITPGLDHRGARRIVAGDDGERYYTDDHYESFEELVE